MFDDIFSNACIPCTFNGNLQKTTPEYLVKHLRKPPNDTLFGSSSRLTKLEHNLCKIVGGACI